MARGQRTAVFDQDTEAAEAVETALVRLVWRDGRVDKDEVAALKLARRSVELSSEDAYGKTLALAILRCGESSPRVVELKRGRPDADPTPPAARARAA